MLYRMNDAGFDGLSWGPIEFRHQRIALPNKLQLHYDRLHQLDGGWSYFFGREQKWIFGGKLLENIVQALARIVVMDAALAMKRALARLGDFHLALQAHDELVYVVPEELADVVKRLLLGALRARPSWAPALPLDAEVGVGKNYGEAH